MTTLKPDFFFEDTNFHRTLFNKDSVFMVLEALPDYIRSLTLGSNIIKGNLHPTAIIKNDYGIVIEENAYVDACAVIQAPAYIGRNTFIGHGALVRPNTITGHECVIGHCTEIKDSVMFPRSRAAHFNFIGDSVLGTGVNLGGGTIISNFEFQEPGNVLNVHIRVGEERVDTGLQKLGAIIGDFVSTGSNSVLSPGSLIGKKSAIYPSMCVRKGLTPPESRVSTKFYEESNSK